MQNVDIAEAESRFSELISRVGEGERFAIWHSSQPLAVLINPAQLEQLERQAKAALRLASVLGQGTDLVAQIERGEVHPVMAAFGLWKDERDVA